MRLLLAVPIVLIASSAHAQYGGRPPYSPGYPAPPPNDAPPYPGTAGPPSANGNGWGQPGGGARSLAYGTLAPQNAVRAAAGEPPLRWSDRLADAAQDWAEHLAGTGQFVHKLGDRYGENLYEITGGSASPQQVVAAWADEVRNYDIRSNTCNGGMCGHYTQIVWQMTRAVGCGVAGSADREVWVCEYDPPGNVVGERPY